VGSLCEYPGHQSRYRPLPGVAENSVQLFRQSGVGGDRRGRPRSATVLTDADADADADGSGK